MLLPRCLTSSSISLVLFNISGKEHGAAERECRTAFLTSCTSRDTRQGMPCLTEDLSHSCFFIFSSFVRLSVTPSTQRLPRTLGLARPGAVHQHPMRGSPHGM